MTANREIHPAEPAGWGRVDVPGDALEGLDAPEKVGGPGFGGGERGTPDGQNLRALVDAFETFFGFGDGFDWGDPELLGARSVQGYANALPAIFHAERGTWDAAAEAQILRTGRRLEKTVGLGGRQKIEHGLDAHGEGPVEGGGQRNFDFASDLASARRGTKRK